MAEGSKASHDIDIVLWDFGVRTGSRDARAELAQTLAGDGLTAADARFLGERIDEGSHSVEHTARLLAGLLGDPERWKPTLADLRHAEVKRQERMEARTARQMAEAAPGSTPYPNMARDPEAEAAAVEGLSVPQLRHRRWCRFVWAAIQDGRTSKGLAAEHGVSVGRIQSDYREWENYITETAATGGD